MNCIKVISIIFIAFCINVGFSFAQNTSNSIQVNYLLYANTESPRVLNAYLEASELNSYYVTYFKNQDDKVISQDNSELVLQLGSNPQIIHINLMDSLLQATKKFRGTEYKISEKIPQIKWEITNETKFINEYLCSKATCDFRGRSYVAWFTEDIPIRFGPYKFNGLPGLIIEIYDITNRFHWVVSEIKTRKDSFILERTMEEKSSEFIDIDLIEFVKLTENRDKEIKTRLPRGVEAQVNYRSNRNGIELTYEWEEN